MLPLLMDFVFVRNGIMHTNRFKTVFLFVHSTVVSPKEAVPLKISPPSHYPTSTVPSTSPPLTSPPPAYPAVLVGRSSSELKAKVPPPVPPRGTQKVKRGESNGKGAHCLQIYVSNVARLHDVDVHFSPSYANSPYCFSPCVLPHSSSREYLKAYASHKAADAGSLTDFFAANGYFHNLKRPDTSFSDSSEIEHFV